MRTKNSSYLNREYSFDCCICHKPHGEVVTCQHCGRDYCYKCAEQFAINLKAGEKCPVCENKEGENDNI